MMRARRHDGIYTSTDRQEGLVGVPCHDGHHGLCSGVVSKPLTRPYPGVVLVPCACWGSRTCRCRTRTDAERRTLVDAVAERVRARARRLGA